MTSANMTAALVPFMSSPLATWVKTFQDEEGKMLEFRCLCDGVFLYNIWLQIDPHPPYHGISQATEDINTRIRNLDVLVHNIKAFYEEVLEQIVVLKVPDIVLIARNPDEEACVEEMKTLLLLILGCAVQCERKEYFIENIKSLDLDVQHKIVECIQQVTDNPETLWTNEWNELNLLPQEEQEHMYTLLVQHLRQLVRERDELAQRVVNLVLEQLSQSGGQTPLSPTFGYNTEKPHLVVELADVKSRLRKLLQELEEKNESITELKEELELSKDASSKLRQENLELIQDARTAKAYRDEIDILRERVRKVDRLESEIQRYKDKMNELDFYRSRVEELREDNRILAETKAMLEEQLEGSRKRADQVVELEAEILKYCAQLNELTLEREGDRERIQQLLEENAQLNIDRKAAMEEVAQLQTELSLIRMRTSPSQGHSLLEQLNSDAQTRALQLELENQRLRMMVESFDKSPFLELRDHQDDCQRWDKHEMPDIEEMDWPDTENGCVENEAQLQVERVMEENVQLTEENQKLLKDFNLASQRVMEVETHKQELERTAEELRQSLEHHKVDCAQYEQMEQTVTSLTTENQKLQRVIETNQRKIDEMQQDIQALENENQKLNNNVESLKLSIRKYHDLERETTHLEAENHKLEQEKKGLEKENNRLKNAMEMKDSTIEEYSSRVSFLERENKQLQKEMENWIQVTTRLRDLERENKDLSQQTTVDKKALAAFRQELVSEKIKNQQLSSEVDRISSLLERAGIKKEFVLPELDKQEEFIELKHSDSFLGETLSRSFQENEKSPLQQIKYDEIEKLGVKTELEESLKKSANIITSELEKQQNGEIINFRKDGQSLNALTKEIQVLKVDMLDLEKKNNSLEEENRNFSNQTSSLKEHNNNLRSQVENMEQHLSSMTRQNCDQQSRLAKLEVEITLMTSQNASLSSQNATLQTQITGLEEQRDQIQQQLQDLQASHTSLLTDHGALQKLHEQLTSDYEYLAANYSSLKSAHKNLKMEHNSLKEKQANIFSQEEVMKLREVLEEESPRADGRSLVTLRSEHTQVKEQLKSLKDTHEHLVTDYKSLQATHKALKTENNELKLKHTELQGELAECRSEMAALNIKVSKLTSCCELLSQKNTVLEEEQQSLMSNVTMLLGQYHELLFQAVSDNGAVSEDNEFKEKLRELCQQKEKIEQKILDHCHRLEKSPKRKHLQPSGVLQMRRTRSAFLKGVKHNDLLGSQSDTSTDSSIHTSHPKSRSSKSGGWSKLPRGSLNSTEDSSQDDHIPVRDVGPSGHWIRPESTNVPMGTESAKSQGNGSTAKQFAAESTNHHSQTTVENHMTVNLITNVGKNPSNGDASGGETYENTLRPFSRSLSTHQITPYRHRSYALEEPNFLGHEETDRSPRVFGSVKNTVSPTSSQLTNGQDVIRNFECGKSPKSRIDVEKVNNQNTLHGSASKDRRPENSVWYEYGCV